MDNTLLTVLSALFVLILGNYAFTWHVASLLFELKNNHLEHIEERLKKLERE